jgi:hypothetical protein
VITGLQDKFSWAGVAAAGVGAGVGRFVAGTKLAGAIGARSSIAGDIFISGADAIGNAATRSLLEGSDFGDNIAAALPDVIGGAIGRWIGGGGFSRMSEAARMRAEAADMKVDPLTIKPMNDRIVVDYSRAGLDPITAQMPIAGAPEASFKSEADRAAGDNWINKVSARIGANLEPAQATGVELGLRRRDLATIANAPISGAASNTNPTWPFGEFENTGRLSDIPKRPVGFAVEAGKEIWNGMEAGFGGGAVVSGAAGAIGSVGSLAKLRAAAEKAIPSWTLGVGKSAATWTGQMERRGWTPSQIDEALASGKQFSAPNNLNPANGATRFVHPETGRSVVIDSKTGQVIHVGGNGFKY